MKKAAIVLAALAVISAAGLPASSVLNISGAVDSVVSTDAEKCVAK